MSKGDQPVEVEKTGDIESEEQRTKKVVSLSGI